MRTILSKDQPFLWSISKVPINYYSLTKIWGLEIFDNETTALKIFLKICTEMRFHCLFSLNEKIIAIYHLMIHIKCIVVICFNKNWSSLKRLFWNNGPPNMLSYLFRFFKVSCLYVAFLPKILRKNCHFLI